MIIIMMIIIMIIITIITIMIITTVIGTTRIIIVIIKMMIIMKMILLFSLKTNRYEWHNDMNRCTNKSADAMREGMQNQEQIR